MAQGYLFLETRDPYTSPDADADYELALGLSRAGHRVRVFLVQNGVLAARRGAAASPVTRALEAGIEVLADDLALHTRGIPNARLAEGVRAAPIGMVLDALLQGDQAIWL